MWCWGGCPSRALTEIMDETKEKRVLRNSGGSDQSHKADLLPPLRLSHSDGSHSSVPRSLSGMRARPQGEGVRRDWPVSLTWVILRQLYRLSFTLVHKAMLAQAFVGLRMVGKPIPAFGLKAQ